MQHYDVVGIAPRNRFQNAPFEYHPDRLLEGFQSAIVFGQGNVSTDEMGGFTDIFACLNAQDNVIKALRSEGYLTVPIRGIDGRVSLVQMAIQAGLGELSPVNSLVVRGYGLTVSIAAILTDAILIPNSTVSDICIGCMACMDDCPATEVPYQRDPNRCGCGRCKNICPV